MTCGNVYDNNWTRLPTICTVVILDTPSYEHRIFYFVSLTMVWALRSLFRPAHQYSLLSGSSSKRARISTPQFSFAGLFYVVLVICVGSASFWLGKLSTGYEPLPTVQCKHSIYQSVSPLTNSTVRPLARLFVYNRTFGEPPSPSTNRAWETLFPEQGGFFKHPRIAPSRSAFSVFHQLHCLVSRCCSCDAGILLKSTGLRMVFERAIGRSFKQLSRAEKSRKMIYL